jgi:phage terminase large subunit-like protein
VSAGRSVAGPHVRAACARHLRDLKTGAKRGLHFDIAAALRAIGFFRDVLRLNGGEHERKPFVLEPWQAFVVGSLFGWMGPEQDLPPDDDNPDGRAVRFRRFTTAFVETGKGSGKSPLAAGIGLYMLMADEEPRAEVYAAAVDKAQAGILFRDGVAMARMSPEINSRVVFAGGVGNEYNIAYLATAGYFRPVSSESSGRGKSGFRPHCVLLDEIHEHPTNAMVEFFRAGTKGRRQPLIFMITNSGVDRTSVCFEYHEYGAKVSAGELEDDSFFAYICALDEGEDPFKDRSCWAKANPSLGVTFQPRYLEEQITAAAGMPSKAAIVLRLNFCRWTDAVNPWIDGDLWRACEARGEGIDVDAFRDRPCRLGLDLSAKRDLTSMAAVWGPDGQGYYDAAVWAWTPQDTMMERERKDKVPYSTWCERGFVIPVPGRSIDYGYIAHFIARELAGYNIAGLAFDQWRIDDFLRAMDEAGADAYIWEGPEKPEGEGIRMVRHGQGFAGGLSETTLWMPRSVTALEDAVLAGKLRVRRNPALTFASASAVLATDPAGNKKWEKRKSTGRIDPLVALCMALGLATSGPAPVGPSVYEGRGVLTF